MDRSLYRLPHDERGRQVTDVELITLTAAILYSGDGGGIHPGGYEGAVEAARELRMESERQLFHDKPRPKSRPS